MIAVDTSALMAVVLSEDKADACIAALADDNEILISAVTVAEALIVSDRRNILEEMESLIEGLGLHVIDVSLASARRAAQAYARWGKGVHTAGLNLGDCFAYEVAKQHRCPLLYVGSDFAKTESKPSYRAFSSKVETGSREENASNKSLEPGSDSIRTEKVLEPMSGRQRNGQPAKGAVRHDALNRHRCLPLSRAARLRPVGSPFQEFAIQGIAVLRSQCRRRSSRRQQHGA